MYSGTVTSAIDVPIHTRSELTVSLVSSQFFVSSGVPLNSGFMFSSRTASRYMILFTSFLEYGSGGQTPSGFD